MSNPALREGIIEDSFNLLENEHVSTVNGVIVKSCILGALCCLTFAYTWFLVLAGYIDKAVMLSRFGLIAGLVVALFVFFGPKNKFLAISTSLYSLCEGLALGFISVLANKYYPGVASEALLGTLIAFFVMFALYKIQVIRCTQKFRAVLITSTFSIFVLYLLQFILGFFHIQIPFIFSNSPIGILFSVAVIIIASLNLIIDFYNIEKFSHKTPSYFEWYFGFSLMVTIIWMYIEILNMLMKLQSRD